MSEFSVVDSLDSAKEGRNYGGHFALGPFNFALPQLLHKEPIGPLLIRYTLSVMDSFVLLLDNKEVLVLLHGFDELDNALTLHGLKLLVSLTPNATRHNLRSCRADDFHGNLFLRLFLNGAENN